MYDSPAALRTAAPVAGRLSAFRGLEDRYRAVAVTASVGSGPWEEAPSSGWRALWQPVRLLVRHRFVQPLGIGTGCCGGQCAPGGN
jgi:hypothetical protein